jgi:hypothetical protein
MSVKKRKNVNVLFLMIKPLDLPMNNIRQENLPLGNEQPVAQIDKEKTLHRENAVS